MRTVLLGLGLVVAGCANAPAAFTAPDGRAGYSIHCGGIEMNGAPDCHRQARELCSGDYDVLRQAGNGVTMDVACTA